MPVVAAFLFSAFALACFIVWLSKGKSRKWLNRKMKLGAAIITVTAVSTGCPPLITTCYDMPSQNEFSIDGTAWDSTGYLKLSIPEDSVVRGFVFSPTYNDYMVKLMKSDTIEVLSSKLIPKDGKFDNASEPFEFRLSQPIAPGDYTFDFWSVNADTAQFQLGGLRIHFTEQ